MPRGNWPVQRISTREWLNSESGKFRRYFWTSLVVNEAERVLCAIEVKTFSGNTTSS